METEEITKLVDGIYKNILDKFNPGARQLINAGKAYLKALHGAAAASRLYVEAISKLARQAQQGTWGGSSDIGKCIDRNFEDKIVVKIDEWKYEVGTLKGSALTQIVEVYKEIQNQQMNILKAFYVDLLVPLETNLEKDTKVVQSEQKRFLQQHKQRSETYSKAAATMKKQRKKNKGTTKTGLAMDKELKNMQVLEEEKTKLDAFCEQSLKTAMTQERRRYGFVLERQCSLAKHYLAYHTLGSSVLQRHLDDWQEVAQTREYLPEAVEAMFTSRLRQVSFWPDEDVYSSPRSPNVEDDRLSIASQLRKTKSMDASCLDMRSISDVTSPMKPLSRAKSDFNLTASTHSLVPDPETPTRPKSMAVPDRGSVWDTQLARALYAYLSSGDNQLSFLEGDVIALMGERNKGWQFGENLRTQCSGWFPLAYTELLLDDSVSSPTHQRMQSLDSSSAATTPATPTNGVGAAFVGGPGSSPAQISGKSGPSPDSSRSGPAAVTMFGDTLLARGAAKQRAVPIPQIRQGAAISSSVGPPPPLPAPKAPLPSHPQTLPAARGGGDRRLIHPPPMPPLPTLLGNAKRTPGAIGNASLHSSNDSGFSNEPPPAPEVDYSDDDSSRTRPAAAANTTAPPGKKKLLSSVRGWLLYKSALDLWDDVNNQQSNTLSSPTKKSSETLGRPLAIRQASSVGHLATLGRFSVPKDTKTSSSEEIRSKPKAKPTVDDNSINGSMIKRSKSLWKFKRSNRDGILEGMSLWQHRSLIDVRNIADLDIMKHKKKDTGSCKSASTSTKATLVAGEGSQKSSLDNDKKSSSHTLVEYDNSDKPKLRRTRDINDDGLLLQQSMSSGAESDGDSSDTESCIVVDDHIGSSSLQKINDNLLSSSVDDDNPSPIPNQQELARNVVDERMRSQHHPRPILEENSPSSSYQRQQQTLPRSAPVDDHGRSSSLHRQDVLRSSSLQRQQQQQLSRAVLEENMRSSTLQNHQQQFSRSGETQPPQPMPRTKTEDRSRSSTLQTQEQILNKPPNLLPRTRLLKSSLTKQKLKIEKDVRENGLLYYGRTLQKRLSKPDRGSRFDQRSQTTGNMCGPWYDLWGIDSSVG